MAKEIKEKYPHIAAIIPKSKYHNTADKSPAKSISDITFSLLKNNYLITLCLMIARPNMRKSSQLLALNIIGG